MKRVPLLCVGGGRAVTREWVAADPGQVERPPTRASRFSRPSPVPV